MFSGIHHSSIPLIHFDCSVLIWKIRSPRAPIISYPQKTFGEIICFLSDFIYHLTFDGSFCPSSLNLFKPNTALSSLDTHTIPFLALKIHSDWKIVIRSNQCKIHCWLTQKRLKLEKLKWIHLKRKSLSHEKSIWFLEMLSLQCQTYISTKEFFHK